MIRFEAFRDRSRMNTREDFELLAQVGLWRSVQSYDCSRGASFESFAKLSMLSVIYDELTRTRNAPERVEIAEACDRVVESVPWELLDDFGQQLGGDDKRVWGIFVEGPNFAVVIESRIKDRRSKSLGADSLPVLGWVRQSGNGGEWDREIARSLGMSIAVFSRRKQGLFRRFTEYLYSSKGTAIANEMIAWRIRHDKLCRQSTHEEDS